MYLYKHIRSQNNATVIKTVNTQLYKQFIYVLLSFLQKLIIINFNRFKHQYGFYRMQHTPDASANHDAGLCI